MTSRTSSSTHHPPLCYYSDLTMTASATFSNSQSFSHLLPPPLKSYSKIFSSFGFSSLFYSTTYPTRFPSDRCATFFQLRIL